MTTTTRSGPFDVTHPVHSGAVFKAFLLCLLGQETAPPWTDIASSSVSEGLNDDDVARKRAIATNWSRLRSDTLAVECASGTDFSEASPESVMTESEMIKLLKPFGAESPDRVVDEPEMINWDVACRPHTREKGSLSVSLHYAGRGKPLADDDPWT